MKRFFRIDVCHWIDLDSITSIMGHRIGTRYAVEYTLSGNEKPAQLGFESQERRERFIKMILDGSSPQELENDMKEEYEKLEKTMEY